MDTFEIAQAFAQPDAGDALRLKWGVVTAANGDKVSVRLPGATTDIECTAWTPVAVNEPVALICKGAIWIAIASPFAPEIPAIPPPVAGLIVDYAGTTAPSGYLMCNGASISRTTYPELFAAIGTTYGSASSTTFNVPDLRDRVSVGRNAQTLGTKAGATTHKHGTANARHTGLSAAVGSPTGEAQSIAFTADNDLSARNSTNTTYRLSVTNYTSAVAKFSHWTQIWGETAAADSMQPYIILNKIITTGK